MRAGRQPPHEHLFDARQVEELKYPLVGPEPAHEINFLHCAGGRYCVRHERADRLLAEDTDVLVLVEPAHDALEGGRAEVPWPFPYEVGAGADVADDHVTLSGEDGTTVRIDTDILDAAATR